MSIFTNPSGSTPEQTAQYVAALQELLGDQDPRAVLVGTPAGLRERVAGMSATALAIREKPGKWSVRHVLAHLADSELVWGWRLRLVLAQDRPTITGYDQDRWADRLGYDNVDSEQALLVFTTLREANLQLLSRMQPEDLERVGVHAERGEESVAHMMRLYAAHDLLHLRQIDRISAARGDLHGTSDRLPHT
jgi:uncharacterized damage-inducible protein DinB